MKCLYCKSSFTKNNQRPLQKFCSKYCRERNFFKTNPIKVKEYQKRYLLKRRKFCKKCKSEIIDRTQGKSFCDLCLSIRKSKYSKKSRQNKKKQFHIIKCEIGCQICGYNKYGGSLDFHHIDPNKKLFTLSRYWRYSWDKLEEEIKKCILLCANCHREFHAGLINQPLTQLA